MNKFIVSLPRSTGNSKKRPASDILRDKSSVDVKPSKISEPDYIKRKALCQTFLDLGQKSFGASKTCKLCGMLFIQGDVDDEARHNSHCTKVLQ